MDGPRTQRRRPWSSGDQRRLLAGLRAGVPPTRLGRELDRDAEDVRHRLLSLLGDPPGPAPTDPGADLDLLWLRIRAGSVLPTPTAGDDVVAAWEDATGVRLSTAQRADLLAEDTVSRLLRAGRHVVRSRAAAVVAATGMLDLGDWAAAVDPDDPPSAAPTPPSTPGEGGRTDVDVTDVTRDLDEVDRTGEADGAFDALPATDTRPDPSSTPPPGAAATPPAPELRAVLDAAVEDVVPDLPRAALRAHLGLPTGPRDTSPTLPVAAERRERVQGVLEVLRAASLPGSPAATLRDRLVDDAAVSALAREFRLGVPAATTLGLLGGRQEADALRVAGQALTRWHRPPNLGRGVVVHVRD
ncbi:hypothetical protein [Mobilicoccus pelagius]|uniref:hypothetical protein n=1 Tax=Mobilicoccus pelagius TaxID=746032 RepID=UPI00114705D4|nr:hypothetical protein [Mobilicoccus pelagius]